MIIALPPTAAETAGVYGPVGMVKYTHILWD